MNYKTTSDFPQWVHDYNHWGTNDGWPHEYQKLADEIYKIADEVSEKIKLPKSWINPSPYNQEEIDNWMGVKDDYETYPVFACSKDERPSDWDYVYDSKYVSSFSRGGFFETKIGDWYFLLGHDYD